MWVRSYALLLLLFGFFSSHPLIKYVIISLLFLPTLYNFIHITQIIRVCFFFSFINHFNQFFFFSLFHISNVLFTPISCIYLPFSLPPFFLSLSLWLIVRPNQYAFKLFVQINKWDLCYDESYVSNWIGMGGVFHTHTQNRHFFCFVTFKSISNFQHSSRPSQQQHKSVFHSSHTHIKTDRHVQFMCAFLSNSFSYKSYKCLTFSALWALLAVSFVKRVHILFWYTIYWCFVSNMQFKICLHGQFWFPSLGWHILGF